MGRGGKQKGLPEASGSVHTISFMEESLLKRWPDLVSRISSDLNDDERRAAVDVLHSAVRANPESKSISLAEVERSMQNWLEDAADYCETEGGSFMVGSLFGFFLSEKDFETFMSLEKDERSVDDQYESWLKDNFSAEAALEDYLGRKRKEGDDVEWDEALDDLNSAAWRDSDWEEKYNNNLAEYMETEGAEKHGFRTFEEWYYDDGESELPALDFIREKAAIISPEEFLQRVFGEELKNLEVVS